MIRMYNRFKKVLAPWCFCLSIEAFLTRTLVTSVCRAEPGKATTKDIDVSHRHDPTKGDAPYKSFTKNDWIPTDAVSRAWPASWNRIQKGMYVHIFVLSFPSYDDAFDSCAFLHALPSTSCMYINYSRDAFLTIHMYCILHCALLQLWHSSGLFHQHSRHRNPHNYILQPQMYNTRLAYSSAKSRLYPL